MKLYECLEIYVVLFHVNRYIFLSSVSGMLCDCFSHFVDQWIARWLISWSVYPSLGCLDGNFFPLLLRVGDGCPRVEAHFESFIACMSFWLFVCPMMEDRVGELNDSLLKFFFGGWLE